VAADSAEEPKEAESNEVVEPVNEAEQA
jgi:hypothetical protein